MKTLAQALMHLYAYASARRKSGGLAGVCKYNKIMDICEITNSYGDH